MSFRGNKPYSRCEGNEGGDRKFTPRHAPPQRSRYFDYKPIKLENERTTSSECKVFDRPAIGHNTAADNLYPNTYPGSSRGVKYESSASSAPNAPIKKSQKKSKSKFTIKLNDLSVNKLTSEEGVKFLQKLSNKTKVKVKIIPKGETKKFAYACELEGTKKAKSVAVQEINIFCRNLLKDQNLLAAESYNLMNVFQGKEFNMEVLEESVKKLENPNVNWVKLTTALHKKIKSNWGKYNSEKKIDGPNTKEMLHSLKLQYIAMNAVLLGKLDVLDGPLHMQVLKRSLENGVPNKSDEEEIQISYKYIFQSLERLNINYKTTIDNLPPHLSLKTEIDDLFQSATEICNKNKKFDELGKLKASYHNLIYCHYSERKLFQFRRIFNDIKRMDVC